MGWLCVLVFEQRVVADAEGSAAIPEVVLTGAVEKAIEGGRPDPDALVVVQVLLGGGLTAPGHVVVKDRVSEAVGWLDGRHVLEFVGLVARLLLEFAVGGLFPLLTGLHRACREAVVDALDGVTPLLNGDYLVVGSEREDDHALALREVVKVRFGAIRQADILADDVEARAGVWDRLVERLPCELWHRSDVYAQ